MSGRAARELASGAGIGLRAPHVEELIAGRSPAAWLEVHAENYLGGGARLRRLDTLRQDYPVALHAVGLSLGSADGLDEHHLMRLRGLVERLEPVLVSEHLAWSTAGGAYLNHLLPLPYTEETLAVIVRNVTRVQEVLRRRVLVENPSSYLRFRASAIPEAEFLAEVTRQTGCGLLCDVNNLYVTAANVGEDPVTYLDALPRDAVGEIHLAGHALNDADGQAIVIDDHGSAVAEPVWRLYVEALHRFGPRPTLIEWDTNLPSLEVLRTEAATAQHLLDRAAAASRPAPPGGRAHAPGRAVDTAAADRDPPIQPGQPETPSDALAA